MFGQEEKNGWTMKLQPTLLTNFNLACNLKQIKYMITQTWQCDLHRSVLSFLPVYLFLHWILLFQYFSFCEEEQGEGEYTVPCSVYPKNHRLPSLISYIILWLYLFLLSVNRRNQFAFLMAKQKLNRIV